MDPNETFEKMLQLDKVKFKFKKDENSPLVPISLDSVKSIAVLEDNKEVTRWDKIKIKKINSKLEAYETSSSIFLPLVYEGSINLYAFFMDEITTGDIGANGRFVRVLAYIKKPTDEFGIAPLDLGNDLRVLLNIDKIGEMFIAAYADVGNDCPKFIELLTEKKDKNTIKEQMKNPKKEFNESVKYFTEMGYRKDVAQAYAHLNNYLKIIKEYENRCQ